MDMFPSTTLEKSWAEKNEFDSYNLISKHVESVVALTRNK